MTIPTKSLHSSFTIPAYGLGTWEMGGGYEKDTSHDEEYIHAIKQAMDEGVTHIDTAEIYGQGHAEELIGIAIKPYDRAKLFITSKVADIHLKYDDVVKAFEASLSRLQTSYLDLYLIHAPNSSVSLKETIDAMNALVERKLVRNIGVSNFSKERLQEARQLSKAPIVANQVHYNVVYRDPETTGLLEYCQKNDVIVIAFRPLGKRDMTVLSTINSLEIIAKKYDKTPMQIAINWLISQKNVVVIAKTTQEKHLAENLGGVDFEMNTEDIEYIRTHIQTRPDERFSLR